MILIFKDSWWFEYRKSGVELNDLSPMILGLNMDWVVRVGWIQTSRPAVEVDGITGNMGYG